MDAHTIVQRAAEAHVRLVRFMYCDNGGIIRGKATHINGLERRLSEGIGQTLGEIASAHQWWMGDWWRYGEAEYGERAAQALDSRWAFQTWADTGWVAGKIETSRRREVLSWGHHREVAALDPSDQDVWLESPTQARLKLRAQVTERVAPGTVFCPFHFAGHWMGKDMLNYYPEGAAPVVRGEAVNTATTYGYDIVTMMQETKTTLCQVSKT